MRRIKLLSIVMVLVLSFAQVGLATETEKPTADWLSRLGDTVVSFFTHVGNNKLEYTLGAVSALFVYTMRQQQYQAGQAAGQLAAGTLLQQTVKTAVEAAMQAVAAAAAEDGGQ